MKTTRYFDHTRARPDRKAICQHWIEQVVTIPEAEQVQSDGRLRRWGWIESEEKWLCVILLEDGVTLHNAFFDRRFNGGQPKHPTEKRS